MSGDFPKYEVDLAGSQPSFRICFHVSIGLKAYTYTYVFINILNIAYPCMRFATCHNLSFLGTHSILGL